MVRSFIVIGGRKRKRRSTMNVVCAVVCNSAIVLRHREWEATWQPSPIWSRVREREQLTFSRNFIVFHCGNSRFTSVRLRYYFVQVLVVYSSVCLCGWSILDATPLHFSKFTKSWIPSVEIMPKVIGHAFPGTLMCILGVYLVLQSTKARILRPFRTQQFWLTFEALAFTFYGYSLDCNGRNLVADQQCTHSGHLDSV